MTSAQNWTKTAMLCCYHSCLSIFLIMGWKRHDCSKSHILATDQPVAVLQALNQILQCTQGCEWYPWKPLDRKHPEGFLYLWGLQYVQMVCEIYTQDVCPKQNALDLATTRTPNQRDGFCVVCCSKLFARESRPFMVTVICLVFSSNIYRHLPP